MCAARRALLAFRGTAFDFDLGSICFEFAVPGKLLFVSARIAAVEEQRIDIRIDIIGQQSILFQVQVIHGVFCRYGVAVK